MGPLKRFSSKAKDSAHSGKKADLSGNRSGNRGEEWDDMPALETVPSIGTQAVETGSSVRVHVGNNPQVSREAEEGRAFTKSRDGDEESIMSGESQKMIIRKEVDIHVQSDGQ